MQIHCLHYNGSEKETVQREILIYQLLTKTLLLMKQLAMTPILRSLLLFLLLR